MHVSSSKPDQLIETRAAIRDIVVSVHSEIVISRSRISQYGHKMRIRFLVVSAGSLISSSDHLEGIATRPAALAVFIVMMVSLDVQERDGTTAPATAPEEGVDFRPGIIEVPRMRQKNDGSNSGANLGLVDKVGIVVVDSGKTVSDPTFVSAARGLPTSWDRYANKDYVVPDIVEQLRIENIAMDGGRPGWIPRYSLAAEISAEGCLRCKEGTIHPPDYVVVRRIKSIAFIPIIVARRKQNIHIHRVKQSTTAGERVWIAEATIPAAITLDEITREEAEGGHGVLSVGVHEWHDGISPAVVLSPLKDTTGGTAETGTAKAARKKK